MPTCPSSSTARAFACLLETFACALTASAIWSPTRYIGCRHANGSWKIIEMSRPRILRSSSPFSPSRFRPSNRISPLMSVVAGFSSPMIARLDDALARAGLADDAERLAAAQREGEVGDRLHDTVSRVEADREVTDVEQGCFGAHVGETLPRKSPR